MEKKEGLGFSARILTSFSPRAVITREYGRRSGKPVQQLIRRIWKHAAQVAGHDLEPSNSPAYHFSNAGDAAFTEGYHSIADVESGGRWRSASKSVLGKFEYWCPCVAMLTELCARGLGAPSAHGTDISDCALKCAVRFFDLRLALGCIVTDTEVQRSHVRVHHEATAAQRPQRQLAPSPEDAVDEAASFLRRCPENPITYTVLASRLRQFRGKDKTCRDRYKVMANLASRRWGWLRAEPARTVARNPDLTAPLVSFHRFCNACHSPDTCRTSIRFNYAWAHMSSVAICGSSAHSSNLRTLI